MARKTNFKTKFKTPILLIITILPNTTIKFETKKRTPCIQDQALYRKSRAKDEIKISAKIVVFYMTSALKNKYNWPQI